MVLSLALALSLSATDGGVTSLVWDERSAVKVPEGTVVDVVLKKAPSRLAASDPAVCEVTLEKPTALRVKAKKPGSATVALWYGIAMVGLQVDVLPRKAAATTSDAGVPFFTWDGEHGFHVPRDVDFVVQGPGGLERVAPGSHRRCQMTSIGNDQLRFICREAGPVSVFLWYANERRRTLELDVDSRDGG